MNDTMLFLVGCGAFGLMMVGVVFTVLEFRAISERQSRRGATKINVSSIDEN
jgi:hypothetical protein